MVQLFIIYNQADSVYNMFIEFEGTIVVDKLTNEDNYYSVNVSWKSIRYGVDEQYIIDITPPVESWSNFTTSNTSITVKSTT